MGGFGGVLSRIGRMEDGLQSRREDKGFSWMWATMLLLQTCKWWYSYLNWVMVRLLPTFAIL